MSIKTVVTCDRCEEAIDSKYFLVQLKKAPRVGAPDIAISPASNFIGDIHLRCLIDYATEKMAENEQAST